MDASSTGQPGPQPTARIDITTRPVGSPVDPFVHGHFLESAFFGNIEGGVLDEGSELSVRDGPLQGCRADVLEAVKDLGVPVLRWPGGNFTSAYWWQDGIGPRDRRPRRLELAWGSEESNRFGTPEFLAWCAEVGAAPYLAHHCRSVEDAVRWVEYANYAGTTDFAGKRAADGHPEPWGVRYWGLGNEVYGEWQMGHRPVAQYVADARQHARFMRAVDPSLSFIACGWQQEDWLEQVVAGLGNQVDYVSLHLYGLSRHLVDPSSAEFDAVVAQSVSFEREIIDFSHRISRTAAEHGITRPLGIALDEWNIRHLEPASWPAPQPGPDGGVGERTTGGEAASAPYRVNRASQRTLADALFYAGVFHALHRSARLAVPVSMANTVNLINANGLINVRPEGLVRTGSFHVWDLYQNHVGPIPTAHTVSGPVQTRNVRLGAGHTDASGEPLCTTETVPLLDVLTSLFTGHDRLSLVVINRSSRDDITVQLSLDGSIGRLPTAATTRCIGADEQDLFAVNTIGTPDRVTFSKESRVNLDQGRYTFGAHTVTLLSFHLV